MDTGAHRQGRVERRHVVKIVRESRLGLLHQLRRSLHGLDGVGAGQLVDGDARRGAPVEAGVAVVGLPAPLHPPHLPPPHPRSTPSAPHPPPADVPSPPHPPPPPPPRSANPAP